MARDSSLYLRQGIVTALKQSAPVAAIVGPRVYGPNPVANAVWPFVRVGFPIVTPFTPSGTDGCIDNLAVHGFAKGDDEGIASSLGAAICGALGDVVLTLPSSYPAYATMRWTGSQIVRDSAEASAWHAIVQFTATIAS